MKLPNHISFILAIMVGDFKPSSSSLAYLRNYTNLTINTDDFTFNMIYQKISLIMISDIFYSLLSKACLWGCFVQRKPLSPSVFFERFPSPVDQSFATGVSDFRFSYRDPVFLGNNYPRLWGLWIWPVWRFEPLLQVKEIFQQWRNIYRQKF